MRHTGRMLCLCGIVTLAVLGCRNTPNLQPDKELEGLNKPDPNDTRYSQPARYPSTELANDPVKKSLREDSIVPLRGSRANLLMPAPGTGVGTGGTSTYP